MVIDCHTLIGPGLTWEDPEREVNYNPRQLLEHAAQAGIDRLCVVSPRNTHYASSNRSLARICEQYRDKLIGFAVHSPQREAGRLQTMLGEEVKSMGLRGVRSDGAPTRELLDTAAELGIPVMYYPKLGPGQGPARWYHMIASAYPGMAFILPHLGQYRSSIWWAHMEALDLVKRYPNVYVDTSGIGSLKYLEMAARELPAERMLFGSFAPELDARVAVESIRLLQLPADRYARVMGQNVLRLLNR